MISLLFKNYSKVPFTCMNIRWPLSNLTEWVSLKNSEFSRNKKNSIDTSTGYLVLSFPITLILKLYLLNQISLTHISYILLFPYLFSFSFSLYFFLILFTFIFTTQPFAFSLFFKKKAILTILYWWALAAQQRTSLILILSEIEVHWNHLSEIIV